MSGWIPVLDPVSCQYYYYDPSTQATSWELPSVLETSSLPLDDPFFQSQAYYNWYSKYYQSQGRRCSTHKQDPTKIAGPAVGSVTADGQVAGAFNSKTGKFQNISRDDKGYAPDPKFSLVARAEKHMSLFFDYSGYQEQRGAERQAEINAGPEKKKLSRKEIQRFKAKKAEKKRQRLLKEYRDDMDQYM